MSRYSLSDAEQLVRELWDWGEASDVLRWLIGEVRRHQHDETPPDLDWLRAVGFGRVWKASHAIGIVQPVAPFWCLYVDPGDIEAGWAIAYEPHGRCFILHCPERPKTRGDVRRLCSALGVQLQEQP